MNPKNLSSTQNIAGYILPNSSTGYCDDGDYGMGRAILRAMEPDKGYAAGLAVFVTRQYGGVKLGLKRF